MRPALVDDIEELLEEPEEPQWVEDDEEALIAAVGDMHSMQELTEMKFS
jgi:hypothetical protein